MGITFASEVNHCFAIEMYFKTLSIITTDSYVSGHPLDKLFNSLQTEIQQELITHFDNKYKYQDPDLFIEVQGLPQKGFKELIEDSKDTFVGNRYLFDKSDTECKKRYSLDGVILTLRDIIFIKRPELFEYGFATQLIKK